MIEQEEELIFTLDEKLMKTLDVLQNEFMTVKAGRANGKILDKVTVDYYGVQTPIAQVSTMSTPDGRCLVVAPWDTSLLRNIEKAILAANIGITPTNDGKVIRLVFPILTEERRKELCKQIKKMGEDAKVAARNNRREAMDAIKKLKNDKLISEDSAAADEKEVEKSVQDAITKIDAATAAKEKEIMTI